MPDPFDPTNQTPPVVSDQSLPQSSPPSPTDLPTPPISPYPTLPIAPLVGPIPSDQSKVPAPPPPIAPPPPEPTPLPPVSEPSLGIPDQPIPPPPTADEGMLPTSEAAEPPGKPRIQGSVFKFLIPILGGLLLIGGIIFAATRFLLPKTKTPTGPEPVNLTYWGLWEEPEIIKAVLADYQQANPHVTINYQQQSHKDYRERLQSALAQGTGPDIFRFHNTWVPMLKNELAPLPPSVFDATSFSSTFYPVANQDLNVSGNILGVPLMIEGLGLYYNKDIFESGGKSPPTDWVELRQVAFDLTVRNTENQVQTAGVALGTTGNIEHWPDILALMLLQNGADPANPTGSTAEDALKFYTIFAASDKVWDNTLPNSVYAFATEKVAMIFAPSWQAHSIKQINPHIEFGIVPVPQLPNSNVTWASYWVEGVSKKSPKQIEAFKLLKFLSEKDKLVKFYTEASKTRLFGEPYSRQDLADTLKSDPLVGPFITQAPNAKSFYLASRTFDNGINDKIIKYYEDAINAVNEGADPAESLQTVAQGVQQVLSQYGVTAVK